MNRIAIVDLGTNTFNLLIVSSNDAGRYETICQTKEVVKLGEGSINKGYIAPIPFQRGLDAMAKYKEVITKHGAEKTIAIATSAIRDADNGTSFIDEVKRLTAITITPISGDDEAELIYLGIKSGLKMTQKPALIIDIGGGSTEFIIATNKTILWKQSFTLGAARLLEFTAPSDPITANEIIKLTDFLGSKLTPLFEALQRYPCEELIGSSGAFDSLAQMIALQLHSKNDFQDAIEYSFELKDLKTLYERVLKSTTAERLKMPGLIAMRVDMIVVSYILLNFIIEKSKVKSMRSSSYSLKEGVLSQISQKNSHFNF